MYLFDRESVGHHLAQERYDVKHRMVAGALLPGIIDGGKIRPNGEITKQGQRILQHSMKMDPSCRKRPRIAMIEMRLPCH